MDQQSLIKTIIETQVIEALNTQPEAIEKLVKACLSEPVDSVGKRDGYGQKYPYLDWMVGEEIRRAAREAICKVMADYAPRIEAEIRKGLSSDSVVAALTTAFVGAASQQWKIDVRFVVDKDR